MRFFPYFAEMLSKLSVDMLYVGKGLDLFFALYFQFAIGTLMDDYLGKIYLLPHVTIWGSLPKFMKWTCSALHFEESVANSRNIKIKMFS